VMIEPPKLSPVMQRILEVLSTTHGMTNTKVRQALQRKYGRDYHEETVGRALVVLRLAGHVEKVGGKGWRKA